MVSNADLAPTLLNTMQCMFLLYQALANSTYTSEHLQQRHWESYSQRPHLRAKELGAAKVDQLEVAMSIQHQVFRLQVSVDDLQHTTSQRLTGRTVGSSGRPPAQGVVVGERPAAQWVAMDDFQYAGNMLAARHVPAKMGSSLIVAQMVAAQAELHLQDNKHLGSTANIVGSDSAASATSKESRWAARQT